MLCYQAMCHLRVKFIHPAPWRRFTAKKKIKKGNPNFYCKNRNMMKAKWESIRVDLLVNNNGNLFWSKLWRLS